MRRLEKALQVALAVTLLLLGSAAPQVAQAQGTTTVGLEAPSLTVPLGSEVVVDVVVSDVTNLYGAEINVAFDQTRLQVRDADGDDSNGVQVMAGDLLQTAHQATNEADNTGGTVAFAASLLRPSPPVDGDGGLVRITFEAVASGSATVTMTGVLLSDDDGMPIDVTIGDSLSLTVGDVGRVVGRVTLQGRSDHSGATVYADGYSDVTDSSGAFRIEAPAGTYTVRTDVPRYLDAQKGGIIVSIDQDTVLAAVKLPGGDANDDGIINIIDLAIIGRAFGSAPGSGNWDERADINGDGRVNICDFALAASNFGRAEPVTWP